jgi:purine-binding chemotaxis protein CheW
MSATTERATLTPDPTSDTGAVPVLAVRAGEEVYGFPLSSVREILVAPPIAEVPRAPDAVLGVISVRGQIVTLLDLPKTLNLQAEQVVPYGRVILIDNESELIGVAVDSVIQVYRMEPAQIEYASSMSAELSDYVVGVGRITSSDKDAEDEMIILIDPVSLLGG